MAFVFIIFKNCFHPIKFFDRQALISPRKFNKMRTKLFIILSGVYLLIGCNTEANKKQKEQKLAEEVIAIHDEVMPKMDQIFKLRKELKDLNNQFIADAEAMQGFDTGKSKLLILHLDSSDKIMMNWMHNYNGGQGLYSHEEVMSYLEDEKKKITHVKEFTDKSIEEAREFLKK